MGELRCSLKCLAAIRVFVPGMLGLGLGVEALGLEAHDLGFGLATQDLDLGLELET